MEEEVSNDAEGTEDEERNRRFHWKQDFHHSRCSYSVILSEHPFLAFFLTFLLIVACGVFSTVKQLGAPALPNFDQPTKGFEARGSVINRRLKSQANLQHSQEVSPLPFEVFNPQNFSQKKRREAETENGVLRMCDSPNKYLSYIAAENLYAQNMKLVFKAKQPYQNQLLSAESLRSVCWIEESVVRSMPYFEYHCHRRPDIDEENPNSRGVNCCPSWSLGNYIAALNNKISCNDITDDDVLETLILLKKCQGFYHNGSLDENCWDFTTNTLRTESCPGMPLYCVQYNAVFNILHYLTNENFLKYDFTGESLELTSVIIPIETDDEFQTSVYKKHLQDSKVSDDNVELVAFKFSRLKFLMFNKIILTDLKYPMAAMACVLLIMWIYTESLFITILLFFSVLSALTIAYFIYVVVLQINFFPFLNITTFAFLVGIGADDCFVLTDVWRHSKMEHPRGSWALVMSMTLKHASLSMFVTSLTTAAAFMANLSSEITTIRCFGLFAGIAILCKFFLMITWFPAAFIIQDRWLSKICCGSIHILFCRRARNLLQSIHFYYSRVFDFHLPNFILHTRYMCFLLFLCLAGGGVYVVIWNPGLQLPTSTDFQVFTSSHVLEAYDLYYKDKFRYEKSMDSSTFPLDFVWGIKAVDNGNELDPDDYGSIQWDDSFDVVAPESQVWLLDLCSKIRNQNFYAKKRRSKQISEDCFVYAFYEWMRQECTEMNYPCCKETSFPFNQTVFDKCASKAATLLYPSLDDKSANHKGGAKFDRDGNIRAVVLRFPSNKVYTRAYNPVHTFWNDVTSWADEELSKAPSGLQHGWTISMLEFYDLQRALSKGTIISMGISIATAFSVMLLTTLNIFISLYAIITIVGTISVTVGSLVLMGWKLNILESITMSVAVGLSIDFAMHYGVAYCLAISKRSRLDRVHFSISRMGSAISMAAFTTFLTGTLLLPSEVLCYIQLGHFLMLVMSISWLYSTFFFQSLCCMIGPQGNLGQLGFRHIKNYLTCHYPDDSTTNRNGDIIHEVEMNHVNGTNERLTLSDFTPSRIRRTGSMKELTSSESETTMNGTLHKNFLSEPTELNALFPDLEDRNKRVLILSTLERMKSSDC